MAPPSVFPPYRIHGSERGHFFFSDDFSTFFSKFFNVGACTLDPVGSGWVCVSGGTKRNQQVARIPEPCVAVAHVTGSAPRCLLRVGTYFSSFCTSADADLEDLFLNFASDSSLLAISRRSPCGGQDADKGPLVHTVASGSDSLCSLAVRYSSASFSRCCCADHFEQIS